MKRTRTPKVKVYNYEWTTAEEIIANMNTRVEFPTFGIGTLVEICGATNPDTYRKAHELWLKLKAAFNAEAATYDPEAYDSALGSVGSKNRREVLRTSWWDELSDLDESYYSEVTIIIEILHDYEDLETGKILFGS